MSSIHFIIFMLFLTICDGIKCIDKTQVKLSTSEIMLNNIETFFNDLKTSTNKICQVYMEFDSIAQIFTIKFDQSIKFPRLRSVENTYIHIATSIKSANVQKKSNQTSIKTKIHMVCYSNNECDRQLVLEHINWLIKTNYQDLESIIRPLLLVQGDKKNECTVGDEGHIKPCYRKACSWYSPMNIEQGQGKCENIDSHVLPVLNLVTEITLFEKHKKEEKETDLVRGIWKYSSSMKFWCELNNCNNNNVGQQIKEAVSKQYDIWATHKIHRTDRNRMIR